MTESFQAEADAKWDREVHESGMWAPSEIMPGVGPEMLEVLAGIADQIENTEATKELQQRITDNPLWFVRECLGNESVIPEKPPKDWMRLFDYIFSIGKTLRRGVVNSPRNTLKSTLLSALCVYLICMDRNIRILYVTNRAPNAVSFSARVKAWLEENEFVRKVFGTFKPEQKQGAYKAWRDDYFYVSGRTTKAREPTLTVASTGQTKVGMHYDIILVDDGVDQENSMTADGIHKVIEWFRLLSKLLDDKSAYGTPEIPGGVILDVGTRYADGDLHGWLLGETDDEDSPAHIYERLVLKALNNPESWDKHQKCFVKPDMNFEGIISELKLNEERAAGSYWFYTQYQNECIAPEDAIFRREDFKIIPAHMVPKHTRRFVLADYAPGLEEQNDRTAIWTVALDWKRAAYCIDFDVGRWSMRERIRRTVQYAVKHRAEAMALEDITANEGMYNGLQEEIDRIRFRIRIEKISGRSTESKKLRIISLQPRFEMGRIFFVMREDIDGIGISSEFIRLDKAQMPRGEIVEEFVRFPKAVHDDIPDALSDIDKRRKNTGTYIFAGAQERSDEYLTAPRRYRGQPVPYPNAARQYPGAPPVAQDRTQGDFWQTAARSYKGGGDFFRGGRHA